MKYIKYKRIIIITLILICISLLIFSTRKNKPNNITMNTIETKKVTLDITNDIFYVDIKGEVNNPGVYSFKENDRVIDAIKIAGGLKKSAYTDNINLSQKLTSEMVIVINKKSSINNSNLCSKTCETKTIEINNCIEMTTTINNKKVNINTATKEELMTIEGVGESKADSIIKYREENKGFKQIEEIKNVSGIGDSIYERIKEEIEI